MSTGHLLRVTMGYYSKTRQTEHSSVSLDIKKALSGFLSALNTPTLPSQWSQSAWSVLLAQEPLMEQCHAEQTHTESHMVWDQLR